MRLLNTIAKQYPHARTQFLIREEQKAIEQVLDGEAHLALITSDPPTQLDAKQIAKVEFNTCASKNHPIFKKYGSKETIPVSEILKYPFVSPDSAILGKISKTSSTDGWRDDKFPRQIKYKVCGLKLVENLIREGLALGYLPDYFVNAAGFIPLKISGCPYYCLQTVRLISKEPASLGWLNRLWGQF